LGDTLELPLSRGFKWAWMLDAGTDVSRSDLHVGEERLRAAGTLYCFFGGRCWGKLGEWRWVLTFFSSSRGNPSQLIFFFKSNQKTGRAEKIP